MSEQENLPVTANDLQSGDTDNSNVFDAVEYIADAQDEIIEMVTRIETRLEANMGHIFEQLRRMSVLLTDANYPLQVGFDYNERELLIKTVKLQRSLIAKFLAALSPTQVEALELPELSDLEAIRSQIGSAANNRESVRAGGKQDGQ